MKRLFLLIGLSFSTLGFAAGWIHVQERSHRREILDGAKSTEDGGLQKDKPNLVRPQIDPECILKIIAKRMNTQLRPEIPAPTLHFESESDIKEFQDAIEHWWGMRPELISNVFIPRSNQIYLIDDESYYSRVKRSIDDSLAHEYVHFIQVQYKGYDLRTDDTAEYEAIDIQTWFRDTFVHISEAQRTLPEVCL